jgi:hypothetical protein
LTTKEKEYKNKNSSMKSHLLKMKKILNKTIGKIVESDLLQYDWQKKLVGKEIVLKEVYIEYAGGIDKGGVTGLVPYNVIEKIRDEYIENVPSDEELIKELEKRGRLKSGQIVV